MIIYTVSLLFSWVLLSMGAVAPPPWANPSLNPCASQPGGWQLLYWPPNGKCFKIFQKGYPCPENMELTPETTGSGKDQQVVSVCKCPPGLAQSSRDGRCYDLFSAGPCEKGSYFSPDPSHNKTTSAWGKCNVIEKCANINQVFWPKNGQCYPRLTRGPCPKGQLLVTDSNGLASCKCNNKPELRDYFHSDKYGCFEHFTKGPCKEKGHLFLADKTCGCHNSLPHYHEDTNLCYEIGSIGPCNVGETFQLDSGRRKGLCACKLGHVRYAKDNVCYRPYTQGPCGAGNILVNSTSCIRQPCERHNLYFPQLKQCFRIGSKGPCEDLQVVTFDFETRPSIDGISYNGVCSCPSDKNCTDPSQKDKKCEPTSNTVLFREKCYKLYTQGPCAKGAWIIPKRKKKDLLWTDNSNSIREGLCDCVPGYTKIIKSINNRFTAECISPTVLLANYLNKNFFKYKEDVS